MKLLSPGELILIKNHYNNDGNIKSLLTGYEELLKFYNSQKFEHLKIYDESGKIDDWEYGGEG